MADLRGVSHPERVWLVGGHFDDNSENPYYRAPGADDNATGTVSTMLIAALLRGYQFSDTIRFVHFSGEEQGQWGSRAYANALRSAGIQVMGFINLDMIGWDGNGDRRMEVHAGTGSASNTLASAFISANSRYGQGLVVELLQSSASRFSDHSPFWDNGFASFLAIENFFDGAVARDRNPWYHNTGDLLARVNLNYVARFARTALAQVAEQAGIITGPIMTSTVTQTPGPTATPTQTLTPLPQTCSQRVTNGGFEAGSGWTFTATATQAGYSTAQAYSGARSARFGLLPSGQASAAFAGVRPERNLFGETAALAQASYSSGYQTVSIPAGVDSATLSFWYRPGSQATSGDFQRVLLLDPGTYGVLQTLMYVLEKTDTWQPATFDLSAYRGRSVVVYFEVYNDDITAGPRTWMYLDDVSVLACTGTAPAATTSPTATRTQTGSPAPTATQTPTPTQTPTATPNFYADADADRNADAHAEPDAGGDGHGDPDLHPDHGGHADSYADRLAGELRRAGRQWWLRVDGFLDLHTHGQPGGIHVCPGARRGALDALRGAAVGAGTGRRAAFAGRAQPAG